MQATTRHGEVSRERGQRQLHMIPFLIADFGLLITIPGITVRYRSSGYAEYSTEIGMRTQDCIR